MTETVLSSPTKDVVMGFDRPFVVIGERINPTGRKALAAEMAAGNFETVVADALAQVAAGAQMLDVNAGIPLADEPAILAHTVELVQSITDVPALDRLVDRRGARGRPRRLPRAGARQLGDGRGRADGARAAARGAATAPRSSRSRTTRRGSARIPTSASRWRGRSSRAPRTTASRREDIVVDPLVMPIGAMGTAGRQVFGLLRRLRDELRVNTTCGASNVSFGLPNRTGLNAAFLPMAIASGMTSAITSPLHAEMLQAVRAADVLMGNDEHCAAWIARNGDGAASATAGRRGGTRGPKGDGGRVSSGARVVFLPSGRRGSVPRGATVLDAARRLGVDLDSTCGGRGICGRCQVTVAEGEHAKHGITCASEALTPETETERRYAADRGLAPGRRLGCTALVAEDVVIDVPPESQVFRQVVRKEAEARAIELDPVVRLYTVAVEEPELGSSRSDASRLLDALAREWGLHHLSFDTQVLRKLQHALRTAGRTALAPWHVTVAVHEGTVVTAVWPGFHDAAYGIAFDVGSTTVAGHLCDLRTGEVLASSGAMNPQIRFGEDLMSRVSYVMLNPGSVKELTRAVRGCLAKMTAELCGEAAVERTDVLEVTIVGNPVMHHLLLGIDPTELGGAPFALAVDDAVRVRASELGLPVDEGARAYVLPCIAGHVGADAAGVILAEAPQRQDRVSLIVDVGTNAEIVLGNRERLLAASSPTGPAFEGAQISCGQRAAPGAIERVRIDRETLEPRVKVVGCDAWSDEPGFEGARVTGVCGSGIVEVVAELLLAGVLLSDGTLDGSLAARTSRVVADGRTFSYVLWAGTPSSRSRRTTSGRSSWRRRRSMPGARC